MNTKKKMIIKKSLELGFDVIGFTNIKIKDHVKKTIKNFSIKILMDK